MNVPGKQFLNYFHQKLKTKQKIKFINYNKMY